RLLPARPPPPPSTLSPYTTLFRSHRIVRAAQRELERVGVGRTVALDDHAAQADEARAVVAPMIEPLAKAHQYRERQQRHQPGEDVTLVLLADEVAEHPRETFRGLEGDVADEAIADDDVGRAFVDVVAFDVAVEVQRARAEQFGRLLDGVVALDHFLA